jgi:hypothetical protein
MVVGKGVRVPVGEREKDAERVLLLDWGRVRVAEGVIDTGAEGSVDADAGVEGEGDGEGTLDELGGAGVEEALGDEEAEGRGDVDPAAAAT